jgi:hypothetical protein
MRCFFCYLKVVEVCNKRTSARKGLISYYKTNGITPLKNHVDAYHVVLNKKSDKKGEQFFERNCGEVQHAKKWPTIFSSSIFDFFVAKIPFKEGDVEQQQFVEDLCLLVVNIIF